MSTRRLWTVASVLAITLAFPRSGAAGISEWIWEMSGPSMVGVGLECKVSLTGSLEQCYLTAKRLGRSAVVTGSRFRFSLETGVYFSLGKDSGPLDFEFGKTWMATFDPMIELVTRDRAGENYSIYHGILGLSYNYLVGTEFEAFTNVAFKLRPIGIRYKRMNFEYNLRVYPNGFTADEFGKLPVVIDDNKPEATHGFSVGIALGR